MRKYILHACQESDSDDGNKPAGSGAADGRGDGGAPFNSNDNNDLGLADLGLWSEGEEFPPRRLLGPASDSTAQPTFAAAARSGGGAGGDELHHVHPVVARRGLDFLWYLCKTSFRVTYDMLTVGPAGGDDALGGLSASGAEGVAALRSPVAEAKGSSGKGKGKGRRGGALSGSKGKGKVVEAMDVAGGCWSMQHVGLRFCTLR